MITINEIHVLFLLGGCHYRLYDDETAPFIICWAFCAIFGARMLALKALANEANTAKL